MTKDDQLAICRRALQELALGCTCCDTDSHAAQALRAAFNERRVRGERLVHGKIVGPWSGEFEPAPKGNA